MDFDGKHAAGLVRGLTAQSPELYHTEKGLLERIALLCERELQLCVWLQGLVNAGPGEPLARSDIANAKKFMEVTR